MSMKTRASFIIAAFATVVVALASTGRAAVVGDLRGDYVAGTLAGDTTTTTNPGQWDFLSLDEEGVSGPTLLAWDTSGSNYENSTDNHTDGHGGTFNAWPLVGTTTTFGGTLNANELFVHPGHDDATFVPSGEEFVLLRWTAGAGQTGTLNIAGNIRNLNTTTDGVGLTILVDGVQEFQSAAPNDTVGVGFNINAAIVAGQTVDFIVDHGPAEDLLSDSAALSAKLTLIPTPAALPAGLAMLTVIGLRRRRR